MTSSKQDEPAASWDQGPPTCAVDALGSYFGTRRKPGLLADEKGAAWIIEPAFVACPTKGCDCGNYRLGFFPRAGGYEVRTLRGGR